MRVFRAKVYDGDNTYRCLVAVGEPSEIDYPDCDKYLKAFGLDDNEIHFYFTNDEWSEDYHDGFIETYDKELKYEIFEEEKEINNV